MLLVAALGVMVAALSVQLLTCNPAGTGEDDSGETPGADGGVPLPSTDPGARLRVSIVSWNTLQTNSVANVMRGFRAIEAAGGDVVGLQERNKKAPLAQLKRRLAGTWSFTAASNKVPIAWRTTDYQLVAQGSVRAYGKSRIENGAAGTSLNAKYVSWVELRDRRTGATFGVVNDHKPPSIERRGRPRKDKPLSLELWSKQDRTVGQVIGRLNALRVPVFKTGDENVAAKADARVKSPSFGYATMERRGMYSNWRVLGYPKHGTHGDRLIDYVWATTKLAAPVSQRILGRYGSDHAILVVDLDNRKALPTTRSTPNAAAIVTTPKRTTSPVRAEAVVGGSLRQKQVANAKLVAEGVRAAGGSGRAVYVALVAAVGESDLINVSYGDRAGPDSRGLFQQRNSWGTLPQRMNPTWAAGAFLLGPHQKGRGGLLQLSGWEKLPVTLAIHRVQINANPNHYTKFETRAREIGRQAAIDFDAPAGGDDTVEASQPDCPDPAETSDPALTGIASGPCPLDRSHAPKKANSRNCDAALTWLAEHAKSGDRAWYRRCMALVAVAYGWRYSGNDTAFLGARRVQAAGQMHTSRTGIPKGAVLWWDGRRTGNSAGHVAVYDGNGQIFSNDVKGHGTIGRVPWTYPEKQWGQRFIGWSAPYFPNAA